MTERKEKETREKVYILQTPSMGIWSIHASAKGALDQGEEEFGEFPDENWWVETWTLSD